LHRKTTARSGFDALTKEAAELVLQKRGHKRPLEMGLVFEESRAVFVPQWAVQLSCK